MKTFLRLLWLFLATVIALGASPARADSEIQFPAFRMRWADGFVPMPNARGSAQPMFVNEQRGEALGVTVSIPPKDWSREQVLAQHQRWIDGVSQKMSQSNGAFQPVGTVRRENLASGDVLLSALAESKAGEPTFVLQFLLISPSASAAAFILGGPGSSAGQYERFRPYFESAVWQ